MSGGSAKGVSDVQSKKQYYLTQDLDELWQNILDRNTLI